MCDNDQDFVYNVINDIIKQISDLTILAEYGDNEHYVFLAMRDGMFFVNRDGATLLTSKNGKEAVATFYAQIGTIYEDAKENVNSEFSTLREVLLSNNDFIRQKLLELGAGTLGKSLELLDFDGIITKSYILKQIEFFEDVLCEMENCSRCKGRPVTPSGLDYSDDTSNLVIRERGPNLSGNFACSADNLQKDGSLLLKAEDINLSTKILFLDPLNRLLILKDNGSEWWDLPGGHVMDGESVEEGLHREVKEETGLTVTACRQLFIDSIELGDPPTERPVVFFVGSAFGEVELSEEHLDYLWVKREDLHVYKLGVFIPIINKIYDMLESKDFNDITKFVPAGHMDVTDLGKPDIAQEGGTVKDKSIIQKFDGPSAMMLNSSNEIPNSGFSNREVRHSGEPTDIDRLLQEIAEHRQHIKIEPPIMKTNYSEAGGVADRESIVIEPEQSASFEAGPIQATSSGATIDTPGDDLVAKEASSGIGSAGESSGTIGTNGVMSVSDAFDSTYGGRKVKNNPLEMVEKQNASDISTGVAASAHYDPTPTVVDVDNQSSDTRYADMRPEQRPMGEGEAHLWLEDDGKEDIITNAPLLPQNTDINEENYLSLSDTIQKSKDEADLKVLTRRALKKAEGGKPLVVGGWGNYNLTDREGHKITPKALKPAVKKLRTIH